MLDSRYLVAAKAANIRGGSDHRIGVDEFFEIYPQFATPEIPMAVVELMLDNANDAISENRWHGQHKLAVCLHTAHYLTQWLKTAASPDQPASAIVHAGDSNGSLSSKSVGGVSVSYGATSADSDLSGYGSLRDTVYGQQLASMARLVGKGMMVVR